MVLKINGEMYVAYTKEGPHNKDYCEGGIYHHISRNDRYSIPGSDPYYTPECRATSFKSNFIDPWLIEPVTELEPEFRLCLKCAEKMAEGEHGFYHLDSPFEIPNHKAPTINGDPTRSVRYVKEMRSETIPKFVQKYVRFREEGNRLKQVEVIGEREKTGPNPKGWIWFDEPKDPPDLPIYQIG